MSTQAPPPNRLTSSHSTLEEAWITLLSAARYVRDEPDPVAGPYGLDGNGRLVVRPESRRDHSLSWNPDYGWTASPAATGIVRDLFDLYLPLCNVRATAPITIGHLGQSLDGYIATRSGDSFYVTGPQNIRHLLRMRTLCDAVVVGAKTVAADNPRLTTRLVSGDNPIPGRDGPARAFVLLACRVHRRDHAHLAGAR